MRERTLTSKQEGFAQCIADGMTQADAYRANYGTSGMKDAVIYIRASELMGKVSVRIAELREKMASKALWTREQSVQVLADIAAGVEARAGEKTAAIKELNLMHGFNAPTKLDITGNITLNVKFD